MPVDAMGASVFDMSRLLGAHEARGGTQAAAGDSGDGSPPAMGPAVVLLYGEGFGSIVLAETKTTADIRERMKQLPEIVDSIELGGTQAKAVVTPLGSLVVWERDGVTLLAAGMVSRTDLIEFVSSVR